MDGLILISCGLIIIMLSKLKKEKKDDYERGFADGRASVLNEVNDLDE